MAAALTCAAASAAPSAADPVVAERGPAEITVGQARALVAASGAELRQKLMADPAALRAFLRDILLQRAVLREAHAQKWEQRPDVTAAMERARDQVVAQSFLAAQAPLAAGYPSEAEIKAAYDRNKAQLMQPRTYHLAQIFLSGGAASGASGAAGGDDGRRRVADLRQKLQRGRAAFETAAAGLPGAHYADLGFLPDTALIPEVKSAVAGLLEGAVSEPVCTAGGCSLLRLIATRPAGPAPLASVHDQLARALRQQRLAQEEQAYADGLLAREPVRVNEIELARLAGGGAP